jgi:hypothetical protein
MRRNPARLARPLGFAAASLMGVAMASPAAALDRRPFGKTPDSRTRAGWRPA